MISSTALPFSDVSIVIDASNVCWGAAFSGFDNSVPKRKPQWARPPLRGLVICVNFFERYRQRGASVVAVAPGWWGRLTHMATDDQTAFEQLIEAKILMLAPERLHDDLVILGCAWKDGRIAIITNDLFRDHQANLGLDAMWYSDRRVGFKFAGDNFEPDVDRLETILGDQFCPETSSKIFPLPARWEMDLHEATNTKDEQMDLGSDDIQVFEETVHVDVSLLGLMIGKGGERIKRIETKFGANIRVQGESVKFSCLSPDRLFWARVEFCSIQRPNRIRFPVPVTNSITEEMEIVAGAVSQQPYEAKIASLDTMSRPSHKETFIQQRYERQAAASIQVNARANPAPLDSMRSEARQESSQEYRNKPSSSTPNLAPIDSMKGNKNGNQACLRSGPSSQWSSPLQQMAVETRSNQTSSMMSYQFCFTPLSGRVNLAPIDLSTKKSKAPGRASASSETLDGDDDL